MENRILLKDAIVGKKYKIDHFDVIADYIGLDNKTGEYVFKYISGRMIFEFDDEENGLFGFYHKDSWTFLTEIE